ncbi:MAG: hypothetical protein HY738_21230 [Bacteroidia bacterium]|nr:hypothetical protein [Bacteroidia bacterium]
MILNIDIGYEQILNFIRQLSFPDKKKLFLELHKEVEISKKQDKPVSSLQKLLLQGPTWTEQEYKNFLKTRDQLNQFGVNDNN